MNSGDRHPEELARRLGDAAAERLDLGRVADGVVARLRADREPDRSIARIWWRRPAALRIAAALAVLLGGAVVFRSTLEQPESTALVPAPVLRELSTDQLEEVFDSLGYEAPISEQVVIGLDDLDEGQLRELLRLMEG